MSVVVVNMFARHVAELMQVMWSVVCVQFVCVILCVYVVHCVVCE